MTMSRKRTHRKHRDLVNPFLMARQQAHRLKAAEVGDQLDPARRSFTALRSGVGELLHWHVMASTLCVALAIEAQGVVRGLGEHLEAAQDALDAIEARALKGDPQGWARTPLYWREIDALDTFMDLHQYPLEQLSYGEYREACRQAVARVRSAGGLALDLRKVTEALA